MQAVEALPDELIISKFEGGTGRKFLGCDIAYIPLARERLGLDRGVE